MQNNIEISTIAQAALLAKSKKEEDKTRLDIKIFKPAVADLSGVYISVQEASKANKFFSSWFIYIQSYFTSKLHSSFLHRPSNHQQDPDLKQHHLWKDYIDHKVGVSLVCTTTLYKFDICKLLIVEKIADEQQKIQQRFDDIVKQFLENNKQKLKPISVNFPRICLRYLLSWIPYFGHTNTFYNWSAKEVHDNLIDNKAKTMLCSEFVARLLISCVYELEDSYKNDTGYNKSQPLFKMPFSETERLETLFSTQLSNIMEKPGGCFEKHTWHAAVPQV